MSNVLQTYNKTSKGLNNRPNIGNRLRNFSMRAAIPSVSAGLFGGMTVNAFAGFELEMNKVRALSKASGSEFNNLNSLAKKLGSTTQFSASQAAEGMGFLAMAGFKTDQILKAMPATLNLASAAQVDLGTTADLVSNIMTGFKIKAEDLGGASDVLSATFQNSNTNLIELSEAFKASGPLSKSLGVSFNETNAILGVLASSGYKGEKAGTALAGGMSRLLNPTRMMKDVLKDLNIPLGQIIDKSGKMNSFLKVLKLLEKQGASSAQYMRLFGQEAGKTLVSLKEGGTKNINELIRILERSEGTTKRLADVYTQGVSGAMKAFSSALEGFQIALSESGLGKVFASITNSFAEFFRWISNTNPIILNFVSVLGGIVFIAAPLTFAIGSMIIAIRAINIAMAGANITAGLLAFKLIAITAIVGAVVYAGWFLWKNWNLIGIKLNDLWLDLPLGLRTALKDMWAGLSWFFDKVSKVFSFLGESYSKMFGSEDNSELEYNNTQKKVARSREFSFVPEAFEKGFASNVMNLDLGKSSPIVSKNIPQFSPTQTITDLNNKISNQNSDSASINSAIKIIVDFINTPKNVSVHSESIGETELDLNVAYQGGY